MVALQASVLQFLNTVSVGSNGLRRPQIKFRNYTNYHLFEMTKIQGRLSKDVFERRPSTGSGRFALLSSNLAQILGQIVSIRVKTLGNTNLAASRHIKGEKA